MHYCCYVIMLLYALYNYLTMCGQKPKTKPPVALLIPHSTVSLTFWLGILNYAIVESPANEMFLPSLINEIVA